MVVLIEAVDECMDNVEFLWFFQPILGTNSDNLKVVGAMKICSIHA